MEENIVGLNFKSVVPNTDYLPWIHTRAPIPTGVLTYRRPQYLARVLEAFFRLNEEVKSMFSPFVVVVQGQDQATMAVLDRFKEDIDKVIPLNINKGLGWGFTFTLEELLSYETELVMFLEDDWLCTEPLTYYLGEIYYAFKDKRINIGCCRLRTIRSNVAKTNRISQKRVTYKKHENSVVTNIQYGMIHFTTNPAIWRSSTIKKILPITDSLDAMHKYDTLKQPVAQLQANCFTHVGKKRAFTIRGGKETWIK